MILCTSECRCPLCEVLRLNADLESLRESLHYANGVADLSMQHRDSAEKSLKKAGALLKRVEAMYVAHTESTCTLYDGKTKMGTPEYACTCGQWQLTSEIESFLEEVMNDDF